MATAQLYQLEVKLAIVRMAFPPAAGWLVNVDVDAMELAKGGTHKRGKRKRVLKALEELKELGVTVGTHEIFGRVDVVADHPEHGLRLIEVEGDSTRQKEQALYSCLGQLVLAMRWWSAGTRYGLAVPDSRQWLAQLRKIPPQATARLHLELYAVRPGGVTVYQPGEEIAQLGRA